MTYGENWVKLLGYYVAHEDGAPKALFHERMERCVEELGIAPIEFVHPMEEEVLALYDGEMLDCPNVILSGEAGVGKTRLVHKIHTKLGGDPKRLKAKGPYWINESTNSNGDKFKAHINRDLSASRSFGAKGTSLDEAKRLEIWSSLILGDNPEEGVKSFFVIAANDGQLLKAWKDHSASTTVRKSYEILEECLSTGTQPPPEYSLRIFHMSSVGTDVVFLRCIDALVNHPGWAELENQHSGNNDIFAENSPLRRNYLALKDPIIRKRLCDLARLCDANDWHLPVRNILAMLANSLLGVRDKRISSSGTMDVEQIRLLMAEERIDACNFFANIFGLNLNADWRERTLGPLESFRVGLETSNQADDLILFGPDEEYKPDHEKLFEMDAVFPPDLIFENFRVHYLIYGPKDAEDDISPFQQQLIAQRRRLFFRTPPEMESKYDPWSLTNFHHAKEYLEQLLTPIQTRKAPHSKHLGPLIIAINRIWTGLLLDEHDQLFITTALDFATGRSSEIEVKRIPTKASSGGDYPYVDLCCGKISDNVPIIAIHLKEEQEPVKLPLTLTRYEFLKRVASGALPASFSRECSEDIRAFKSQVLARIPVPLGASIKLLHVNDDGTAGRLILNIN